MYWRKIRRPQHTPKIQRKRLSCGWIIIIEVHKSARHCGIEWTPNRANQSDTCDRIYERPLPSNRTRGRDLTSSIYKGFIDELHHQAHTAFYSTNILSNHELKIMPSNHCTSNNRRFWTVGSKNQSKVFRKISSGFENTSVSNLSCRVFLGVKSPTFAGFLGKYLYRRGSAIIWLCWYNFKSMVFDTSQKLRHGLRKQRLYCKPFWACRGFLKITFLG